MAIAKNMDEYIAGFPKDVQKLLQQMRKTIKKAAPQAAETINYGIPTFTLNGNLVHFAAFKNHIGFYPAPSGIEAFKKELSVYTGAKGSVQFPMYDPLPLELVTRIFQFRVAENVEKTKNKKGKAPAKAAGISNNQPGKQEKSFQDDFLSIISAPARRALENKSIRTLKQLAAFSEKEILSLHGMGPSSIPKLKTALKAEGLSFKK